MCSSNGWRRLHIESRGILKPASDPPSVLKYVSFYNDWLRWYLLGLPAINTVIVVWLCTDQTTTWIQDVEDQFVIKQGVWLEKCYRNNTMSWALVRLASKNSHSQSTKASIHKAKPKSVHPDQVTSRSHTVFSQYTSTVPQVSFESFSVAPYHTWLLWMFYGLLHVGWGSHQRRCLCVYKWDVQIADLGLRWIGRMSIRNE